MIKDYGISVQQLFLEMMLEDAQSYVRVQNIFNAENFDRTLRPAAEFIKTHCDQHKTSRIRIEMAQRRTKGQLSEQTLRLRG